MNEEKDTNQEIINELGADPDSLPFLVNRPFYLAVKNGPLQIVTRGSLVRLKDQTRLELFQCGKVSPTYLRDNDVYLVTKPFRHVDEQDLWLDLHPGQRLRLSVAEAEELLRKNLVTIANMED